MTHATADDYAARYGEPADRDRCGVLLEDASAMLDAEYAARYGADWEEGAHPAFDRACRAVTCAVVARALNVPADFVGATQYTQTAGSYSASMTVANPTADLYLTKGDRARLGLGRRCRVGSIEAEVRGADQG